MDLQGTSKRVELKETFFSVGLQKKSTLAKLLETSFLAGMEVLPGGAA